ncbi:MULTISPECIES: phage tail sheath subtilisin-like domain-containing protein [unclassified Dehalobacter]|uniref:phage tail sheath subtilisin-like domain-containing protein n=1 Tax=unclassified Dehalobacter TaxID=2635733 RepID=UPI00104D7CA7|nr:MULTISPECIES: phage tail sheath subtilisin-like domain-containing protein [unclassified Dehalobacter]TCX51928.1 phage tail sheath protein [Dehalobacter sp. 14DCB1]TCX52988.1 phage tail sheath protein [Dehalobacter sp. 12DCB1]
MAGGKFNRQTGKVRPGTYVNFEALVAAGLGVPVRGIVIMPLPLNWGPKQTFVTIEAVAPDAQFNKLGYAVKDNDTAGNMLYIREALKKAQTVIVYRLAGGVKAAVTAGALTATAKYEGTRGNNLKVVIVANAVSGYDVMVYLDTTVVFEQAGAEIVGDMEANDWVDWSGTAASALTTTAGSSLTGGSDTAPVNSDITKFLDDSEVVSFNSMCFPYTDGTLQTALKTKIAYFRDDAGKKVTAAVPSFTGADYEGIISVINGVILADGTTLSASQACAWVAAADAAATNIMSNTYLAYDGAVDVNGKKTNEQSIAAINAGSFCFSLVNGQAVVEYDINSLTTFTAPKSKDYRKNRVRRVLDTFEESLQLNFPPNKFDNAEEAEGSVRPGWNCMESLGQQILTAFRDAGAIKNVDLENDFVVDRTASIDDETFFNVGLEPVDSAEKLYFTVVTR